MTDLLDRAIREAIADLLDAAPLPRAVPEASRTGVAPRRRPVVLAVGSVVAVGVAGIAIVRHRDDGGPVRTSVVDPTVVVETTTPTVLTTPVSGPVTIPSLFVEESTGLTWSRPAETSTIERSMFGQIVAGPNGFVATGVGIDDGKNQGRVWHSTDGMNWDEPDLALFDALVVGSLVATSTAYFLVAQPNLDRADAPEGPPMLYRSTDGTLWVEVGPAPATVHGLGALGDLLVAQLLTSELTPTADGSKTATTGLATSPDGINWTPAEVDGFDPNAMSTFDMQVVTGGGRSFMRSIGPGSESRVWSSRDGTSWSQLPDPPISGLLTATDRALVITGTTLYGLECSNPQLAPEDRGELSSVQWSCPGATIVATMAFDTGAWSVLDVTGVGPSPVFVAPSTATSQMVIAVMSPTGMVDVSSSTDGESWQPMAGASMATAPQGITLAGSPQSPQIVSDGETVVVLAHVADGSTQTGLLVGRPG